MKRRETSGKVIALRGDRNHEMIKRKLHAQAAAVLGSQVAPYGWQPLQDVPVPEGAAYAAQNGRCAVEGWLQPNPFAPPGAQTPPIMHLAIAERGRPLIWEEMLQVVREACGPQAEAVELYPALRRELRGERNRHLYAFMNGEEWPIGKLPEGEAARRKREHQVAEQVGNYLKDKVVMFVPSEEGKPFRVFRDVADAVAAQVDSAVLREGLVGAIPMQEGFEWSPAAAEYRQAVEQEAAELRDRLYAEMAQAEEPSINATLLPPEPTEAERAAEAEAEQRAEAELAAMRAAMVLKDSDGGDV